MEFWHIEASHFYPAKAHPPPHHSQPKAIGPINHYSSHYQLKYHASFQGEAVVPSYEGNHPSRVKPVILPSKTPAKPQHMNHISTAGGCHAAKAEDAPNARDCPAGTSRVLSLCCY